MNETPSLLDSLAMVPEHAVWQDNSLNPHYYNAGRLCREAATRIRQLEGELAEAKEQLVDAGKHHNLLHFGLGEAIKERDAARAEAEKWKLRLADEEDECEKAQQTAEKWRECAELLAAAVSEMHEKVSKREYPEICVPPLDEFDRLCQSSPTPSSPSSPPTATASPAPETETASRLQALESKQELLLRRTEFLLEHVSTLLMWTKGCLGIPIASSPTEWPDALAPSTSTSTSPPTARPASSGDASCG